MIQQEKYVDLNCYNILPNYYEISNLGNIRLKKNKQILKQCLTNNNKPYLRINLAIIGGRRTFLVHRLVLSTFCPIVLLDKTQVNHIDGNKLNNNLSNLEWVDGKENTQHAVRMGLFGHHPKSTFSEEQVQRICEMLQEGIYSYSDILNILGIENNDNNRDYIGNIKRRRTYKSISKDYIW